VSRQRFDVLRIQQNQIQLAGRLLENVPFRPPVDAGALPGDTLDPVTDQPVS